MGIRTRVAVCAGIGGLLLSAAGLLFFQPPARIYRVGFAHLPPFMTRSGDGSPGGFVVDVVNEASRRRGIAVQWVALAKPQVPEEALRTGTIDLYPMFGITPQRQKELHLSQPWWENGMALVVDKRGDLKTHGSLDGKRIAFVDPSLSAEIATQSFPTSLYVRKFLYEDVIRAVCSGESDAAFMAIVLFQQLLQDGVHGCEGTPLSPILVPEASILYSIGSRHGDGAVADGLAAEVGTLAFDGTMVRIGARSGVLVTNEAKLFQRLLMAKRQAATLGILAGLLALIILVVVWQNHRVRMARRVADRARHAESEFLAHMSHEIGPP